MKLLIDNFSKNIEEGIKISNEASIRAYDNIRNVVICGMGGSGIGGRIFKKIAEKEVEIPIETVHHYNIPSYVDENTLVIASSYSGNTEETLSCVEKAKEKGAKIIGISSGGKLQEFCRDNECDIILIPGGQPPRTALAFSLIQLFGIFIKNKWISEERKNDFLSAKTLIEKEKLNIQEKAQDLALFLYRKVPVLYGEAIMEPVLIRARQQFNENSKVLCWHHVIPEMNHNELVGWGGGDERFAVVFFELIGDLKNKKNQKRMGITSSLISKKTPFVMKIEAKGVSIIEQFIYLIHVVDWASLYLSGKNEVDPMEIDVIDFLKEKIKESNE